MREGRIGKAAVDGWDECESTCIDGTECLMERLSVSLCIGERRKFFCHLFPGGKTGKARNEGNDNE